MSADSYNSDDERYADDTFEQESDTDVPEVGEIESEISEVSDEDDDDRLPSVKMNTSPIKRNMNYTNIRSAPTNTDSVPFDSSSDEEDDVIVGQTLAEINTPSMHFEESQNTPPVRREIRPLPYESSHGLKSLDEQSESSVSEEEEEDSDDEKEFQRIRDMEERYLLQKSAKTPKAISNTLQMPQKQHTNLETDYCNKQETETKIMERVAERPEQSHNENPNNTAEPEVDPIPELIERVMENVTPKPQVPRQIQTDFMEIVQNSLATLQTDTSQNELTDTIITDAMPQSTVADDSIRMTFSFEPNHILNPENIAMAFFNAMNATNATFATDNPMTETIPRKADVDEYGNPQESIQYHNKIDSNSPEEAIDDHNEANDPTAEHGDKEVELEHLGNTTPSPIPDDDDNDDDGDEESYYDTQFEYRITSKTPSCFNSEDYVFHANFIRPTPSTDKLRARPQPRKSMSFSNERMREIERHNQILLRKILTQKPTYVSKSAQHKVQQPYKTNSQTNSQTNVRLTTSAVNRKKQQRQIDLDNQVLKRKIEAIALRRRPLIT